MAEALFEPSNVFDESAKKGIQELQVDFNALQQTDWTYAELHDFLEEKRMVRLNDTCLLVTKAANEPTNDFASKAYRYTFYCQLLPSRRWKSFTLLVDSVDSSVAAATSDVGKGDDDDAQKDDKDATATSSSARIHAREQNLALAAGGLLTMFGKSQHVINLYFQAVETKNGATTLPIGIVPLPEGFSSNAAVSKESKVRKLTVMDTLVSCPGMTTGKNLGSYLQGIQELDLRAQMQEQDWKDLFAALHTASRLKSLRLGFQKSSRICKQSLLELVVENSAIEEIKHDAQVGGDNGGDDIMAKIEAQVAANKSANVKKRGRDEGAENEIELGKLASNMPANAPKTVGDQELPKNCIIS